MLLGSGQWACSGMSGLGSASGNFADRGDSGSSDGDHGNNHRSLDSPNDPGNAGSGENDTGGTGSGGGSTLPGLTTIHAPATTTYIAQNDPSSGYRPGNEGHANTIGNIFISVAAPDGATNCNKAPDDVTEIFSEATPPLIDIWFDNDPNGNFTVRGLNWATSTYGSALLSCINYNSPDHNSPSYKYLRIAATYRDANGKAFHSDYLTITCPPPSDTLVMDKHCLSLVPGALVIPSTFMTTIEVIPAPALTPPQGN